MLQADRSGRFLSRASIRVRCDLICRKELSIILRRESGSVGGVMKGGGATGWSGSKNTGEAQPRPLFLGCGTPDFRNGRDATDCLMIVAPVSAVSRCVHGQKTTIRVCANTNSPSGCLRTLLVDKIIDDTRILAHFAFTMTWRTSRNAGRNPLSTGANFNPGRRGRIPLDPKRKLKKSG